MTTTRDKSHETMNEMRSTDGKEEEVLTTEPPGGESLFAGLRGYNKIITLSSFMCYLIYGGISFTVSIYFVIWRDEFEQGSGITSLVGSVQLAILHFVGTYCKGVLVWCGPFKVLLGLVTHSQQWHGHVSFHVCCYY
jgi:hypothetical protein